MKRLLLLSGGGTFLVLGVLGAIVPGLPATPFLLLASFCFARSSPRLNDALLRSRLIGPILQDWQQRGGVRPVVKVRATIVVILVVSATDYFTNLETPVRVAIALIAMIGLLVIWWLPRARS